MIITAIDIGSTWTKGAAFQLDANEALRLLAREARPTTVHNLAEGFLQVRDALDQQAGPGTLMYSSSAKGGLAVAALGLVPDITSEMAKIAAHSAGARLSQVYSYRLTRADILALEQNPPDILLFAGGTDGGNADYLLANADALARSSLDCPIVYAGNRSVRDELAERLQGRDVRFVDNLLPEIGRPNPEPARAALRDLFLDRIVTGKGLDRIVAATGVEPVPTPYAVYEFARLLQAHQPGWDEFMLIDLGGATTDVYSCHAEQPVAGTVHRGLPEPPLKRTVEGDLGMRVSAGAAAVSGRALIDEGLGRTPERLEAFAGHVERVSANPGMLPDNAASQQFDAVLAGACLAEACSRHAGRMHEVSTVDGLVNVQTGRDLRGVKRIIGSGGYLASEPQFDPNPWLRRVRLDERGHQILVPQSVQYYRDEHYLIPLLANAARHCPEPAARAASVLLQPVTHQAA